MSARRFAFHTDPLDVESSELRVFSDPGKTRRGRFLRRLTLVFATIALWIVVFLSGAQPLGTEPVAPGGAYADAAASQGTRRLPALVPIEAVAREPADTCPTTRQPPFAAMADAGGFNRVFAHLPVSLEWAHLSLRQSCETIDVLVTDWLTIVETEDGATLRVANSETRELVDEFMSAAERAPVVLQRILLEKRHEGSNLGTRLADPATRSTLVSGLKAALIDLGSAGACLDLAQFPRDAMPAVGEFMGEVREALALAGLESCLIINGNDPGWIEDDVTDGFDVVVVKLFYEPWVGSAPRPLSENEWFFDTARQALDRIGHDRAVLALGTHGARWETGVPLPRMLTFPKAMSELAEARAKLTFVSDVSGSHAAYRDETGARQMVWLQDAASAFNQLSVLRQLGAGNIGVWSLGHEDPGVWPLLAGEAAQAQLITPAVTRVTIDNFVAYSGEGPALRVLDRPGIGLRRFEIDEATGLISNQTYDAYPTPYRIERYGQPRPNEIVLTFDDGPHPEFTPQILDILRDTGTPGVFFLLGQNVMNHPGIARRLVEEGHEVGAHSFSHPRMDGISPSRANIEHGLTDRVLAGATGHATRLYREPFLRSGGPISADRVEPLVSVQARGQLNYGMDVVPQDWAGLTSEQIADYVIAEVDRGAGNVILLHDGGGDDRSASVAALPVIISELRARGYVFTSVSEAMGMDRDTLMPAVDGMQPWFDHITFSFASGTVSGLVLMFWIVLLIGVARSLSILGLAALRHRHKAIRRGFSPKVAVIIPAFNEEGAIAKCVESVRASDYPNLEIVVVDDGSTDNTLNEILEFKHKKNVRMISHPNQGKWSALNRAILSLDADIAVCIDADTQVAPDAITKLAEHFDDPKIGAVAGKIVVGNRVNLLTRMQSLEYVTAQNFERRAFDRINGILVVPGAIGAWRVAALHKAGLFRHDTLTEDCDLTISVNRAGYRVIYDERAVAYTEAPQSVRALMAQRLRWSLGMFQSAWKHRRAIRDGRGIGLVSIPDLFVFGYLFPLLAPVTDFFVLLLAYSLIAGAGAAAGAAVAPLVPPEMLWAYLALPALEFLIAGYAVLTDGSAKKSLILVWPLQRIIYRPLLYITVFRTLTRAMFGTLAAWGKSRRHGGNLMVGQTA